MPAGSTSRARARACVCAWGAPASAATPPSSSFRSQTCAQLSPSGTGPTALLCPRELARTFKKRSGRSAALSTGSDGGAYTTQSPRRSVPSVVWPCARACRRRHSTDVTDV
eukprot:COSAG01_NODE_4942_length_4606_cov_6.417573_2_plen_111_part_00